jgi:signal peptidase I
MSINGDFGSISNPHFCCIESEENMEEARLNEITKVLFKLILIYLFILTITHTTTLSNVSGGSMERTYKDNDWLLVNKVFTNINRGDIIVAKWHNLLIVKRVIGVGGDRIEIRDNNVYVNNSLKNEEYIKEKMSSENMTVVVPSNKLFVMGDNRNDSLDSRFSDVGSVNIKQIKGRVMFGLWPIQKVK